MRSRRRVPVVVSAAAALGLLAGCSAESGSPTPAPTTTTTVTAAPSAAPTPSGAPSVDPDDPDAPAGQCSDDALDVKIVESDAGAGSVYYQLIFTNAGADGCELRGYPGVSVVGDGNGTQIGAPAERLEGGPEIATYELSPGDSIGALLSAVNITGGGGPLGEACDVRTGDGWRIYPPHSFEAVFLEAPGIPACADPDTPWLRISPLSAE